MTREELISYCRYFKDEEKNPFENDTPQAFFWQIEKMYVQRGANNDAYVSLWERRIQRYIDSHPDAKNIYTDKNVSIHTKGIAYNIEEMSAKWHPYGPNMVFKY